MVTMTLTAVAAPSRAPDVERSRVEVLEQTIEHLATRLRDAELAVTTLTAEAIELRAWIHELQARLVDATNARGQFR